MRMMVCIPLEIEANSTSRLEIREAVKTRLLDMAHSADPGSLIRNIVYDDKFVVRAPEAPKAG